MSKTDELRQACMEAMDKFRPDPDGTTYCNFGVNYIAQHMGFVGFAKLMANEIVDKISHDWAFAPIEAEVAQRLALAGHLVIAGRKDEPHGHVAVVYPTEDRMPLSGKWGHRAPWIANVGKKNGVMGSNNAFGKEPAYYVLIKDPDTGVPEEGKA